MNNDLTARRAADLWQQLDDCKRAFGREQVAHQVALRQLAESNELLRQARIDVDVANDRATHRDRLIASLQTQLDELKGLPV